MRAREELQKIIELGYGSDFLSSAASGAGMVAGVGGAYAAHSAIQRRGGYGQVANNAIRKAEDVAQSAKARAAKIAASRKVRIGAGIGAATLGAGALYGALRKKDDTFEMSARERLIELAGGYINTKEGVREERGVGAHFNRNAGKYIGATVFSPILPVSLPAGWLIDRSRARHNIIRSKFEEEQPPLLAKGKVRMSARERLNLITFGQPTNHRAGLLSIIGFKEGGDYKRHWSQKKKGKPAGKKLTKKQQAEEDEQHQMSAREQLDEIAFGLDLFGGASRKRAASLARVAKSARGVSVSMNKDAREIARNLKTDPGMIARGIFSDRDVDQATSQALHYRVEADRFLNAGKVARRDAKKHLIRDSAITAGALGATGAGIAYANRKKELSAREELDTIQFMSSAPAKRAAYVVKRVRDQFTGMTKLDIAALQGRGGSNLNGIVRDSLAKMVRENRNNDAVMRGTRGKIANLAQLSAREQLNSIVNFGGDPRPRDPLGRFDDEDNGGVTPESTSITYKQPGNSVSRDLAIGAGGSIVGAGALEGMKALIQKIKSKKINMNAREELNRIINLGRGDIYRRETGETYVPPRGAKSGFIEGTGLGTTKPLRYRYTGAKEAAESLKEMKWLRKIPARV